MDAGTLLFVEMLIARQTDSRPPELRWGPSSRVISRRACFPNRHRKHTRGSQSSRAIILFFSAGPAPTLIGSVPVACFARSGQTSNSSALPPSRPLSGPVSITKNPSPSYGPPTRSADLWSWAAGRTGRTLRARRPRALAKRAENMSKQQETKLAKQVCPAARRMTAHRNGAAPAVH